ncbi:Ni,Fe-hydrogenase III large subunit [Hydrogenispora ethanolica]|uniref:Ni,Fe-hydrogenase III large subunit n=1 Tax=Hydrogenispora ethanolica TaxID=1082276 RepID=A0A4R1R8H3_HYDET|nr:NADH-quinone oxidoreductase subunit C [Hydrogenispora ethanolica]TCL61850.1 Ni,Fe-hydrogenase III large subunit [Hydrogenispora ethanolica]
MTMEELTPVFAGWNAAGGAVRPGEFQYQIAPAQLPELARLLAGKASLLGMLALDERAVDGNYRILQLFGLEGGQVLTVSAPVPEDQPVFPSVTPFLPAAHWYEREIGDLFGVRPIGHPDPRRLVIHRGWPKGSHPLRKDYQPATAVKASGYEGNFSYQQVKGNGVHQVPVGPIHAGIIEPGHFRFHVVGESVLELDARLFYTHRGIEKLAEGRAWPELLPLAERLCGVCTVSHSFSLALALERLTGIAPPRRASYLRVVLAELERVYNHLNDISAICAGVGLALGTQRAAEFKEAALELNRALTGHRYLRGAVIPGGVRQDLDPAQLTMVEVFLEQLEGDLAGLWEAVSGSDVFLDRMQRTGVLTLENALALGAVGPAARASGVRADTRVDQPYAAYPQLQLEVPVETDGDVYSRFAIRFAEIRGSLSLIRQALADLPEGPVAVELPALLPPGAQAFGITESARGSNLHWLKTDSGGRIFRYAVRSASFPNWPALATAVPGNIIPDFPLINKSFELCYACLDR